MIIDMNTGLKQMTDERDASIRDLQNSLDRAALDRDEWRQIAKDLYDYYYLGTGVSKSVRAFEAKMGIPQNP